MTLNLFLRSISLLAYFFLIYYFFSNWTTQGTTRKKQTQLIILIGIVIAIMFSSLLSDLFLSTVYIPYINLLLSLVLICSVALFHNVSYSETFIWTIILVATNLICEVLSLNIAKLLTNSHIASYDNPSFAIIGTSITMLFGFVVIVVLKLFIVKGRISSHTISSSSALFLVLVPVLSIIILLGLLLQQEGVGDQQISETAITSSVIILNICVIFLYNMTIKHQNELYHITLSKNAIKSERRLLEEVKKNNANVLKLKHDLKNQYLIVLGLIESHKLKEAQNYIKDSFQILDPPLKLYAPDSVLNYMLSTKLNQAKENDIIVHHQIFISKNIKIDYDIVAIVLGNIIDNAIQASIRIDKNKRNINIVMKQVKNDLLIEVTNNFNPEELSTRKHREVDGLGMKNIDSLIKEVGGIYRYWRENDKYYVSVVIFNIYLKK